MKKIGVFYGTTSGTTAGVVDELEFYLRKNDYEVHNVADGISSLSEYENLILVTPTYGVGELQTDWENVYDEFCKIDFTGKVVGLIGLGNQYAFGESFVGGIKVLYDVVINNGGKVVGFTSTEGYHYEESEAVIIPEPVTGIEVANDYQHMGLFVSGSGKIRYSVLPGNATNTNVTFKSLNEKVATVDANGVVTGVSEGNADIVITTEEGGFEAKCTVRVDGIDARGIERVGDKTVTMGLNQTRQLQVKITPSDTTNKNVQWTSSNNSVATVDSNGVVTSKNSGSTIITATTHNELKTEFFIEVETPVTNITLNSNEINLNPGGTFKLDATVNPSNASNKNIKWISANESIATVDQSGNVTADVAGTTYISAVSADGKVVATCTVNVSKPVVTKPAKVKIKSAKKKGKKVTLKWKKISDAAGYVVYMKTNSGKFKAVKTVKKAKTVKAVISLKKGNKYSFKIRAYKLDEETNVYGAYSKIKKVKM